MAKVELSKDQKTGICSSKLGKFRKREIPDINKSSSSAKLSLPAIGGVAGKSGRKRKLR